MRRFPLAPILAITLAVAPVPRAAAAGLDAHRAAAGLAVLAVVGAVLQQRAGDGGERIVTGGYNPRSKPQRAEERRFEHRGDAPRVQPHRRQARPELPATCRTYVGTGGRDRLVYGARCLERHVARPGLLPRECLRRVESGRGPERVYLARCLRHDGWALARR